MSRSLRILVPCLGFAIAFFARGFSALNDEPVRGDAEHYLRLAFNMSRHGVFALGLGERGDSVGPTAYREPAYPALLATGMALVPSVASAPADRLFSNLPQDLPLLRPLRRLQVVLALATAVLAALLAHALGGSGMVVVLTFCFVGFSDTMARQSSLLLTENLVTPLLLVVAITFHRAMTRAPRWLALTGLAAGALALTKAAFVYLVPCLILIWLAAAHYRIEVARASVAPVAILVFSFTAAVAPWMARNRVHFGRIFIAERGGIVLGYRAEYNRMSRTEYLSSFLYFAPAPAAHRLLDRLVPRERYARLDRENPDGFYLRARQRWVDLYEELGSTPAVDVAQLDQSKRQIVSHPLRHLLVAVPLAWGGSFVEDGWAGLGVRVPNLKLVLNPLLFLAFFGLCVGRWRRRDWRALGALSPFLFSLGFHVMLTHNIPRYNEPLVPVLWIATAFTVAGAASRVAAWRTRVA